MNLSALSEKVAIDPSHLRHGGCKHNNLVQFANSLHERIDPGSLDHIHIVVLTLNLDWNGEVGLVKNLDA